MSYDSIVIGDYFGQETEIIEFKEFRFNNFLSKFGNSEDQIRSNIENNNWDFLLNLSQCVMQTYIKKYIPKYMVTFANTESIDYGNLYIGVTDYGEITGIPIPTTLAENNYSIIREMIKQSMEKTLTDALTDDVNDEVKERIKDNTRIEIQRLQYNPDFLEDTYDEMLNIYQQNNETYHQIQQDYMFRYSIWGERLKRYTQALNIFANITEIRQEIMNFINEHEPNKKDDLITILLDPTLILYKIGEVSIRKLDKTDITYWITEFRDIIYDTIMLEKPDRQKLSKPDKPYYSLLRDYTPLLKKMVDSDVCIVLIKITFPGNLVIQLNEKLVYMNGLKSISPFRSMDSNNGPCCICLD